MKRQKAINAKIISSNFKAVELELKKEYSAKRKALGLEDTEPYSNKQSQKK